MRTIVVLEGPDFAGKSTLAARLQQLGDARIIRNGPPPEGDLAAHYAAQIDAAFRHHGMTVFDRLHVGELIYGPEFRGAARITDAEFDDLEARLHAAAAQRIHVDAADETLLNRFRGPRGDAMIDGEQRLLRIARAYRALLAPLPAWRGLRNDHDIDLLVRQLQH